MSRAGVLSAAAGGGWRDEWRSFRTAVRLGWLMESNWTDPLLFFVYSVAKPVTAALILVVMLEVISGGRAGAMLPFVVTGSALWSFVVAGIAGLAWSILDDRERYRMLKYVYVSPSRFTTVVIGRGMARIAVGAMGAGITLAAGIVVLGIRFDAARVDWVLLLVAMACGLLAIVALGIAMAAVCLQTRQDSWSYPEALAGALFLVVGAVFPLSVLPVPAQALGLVLPTTWWLEGVRDALFPGGLSAVGGPGSLFFAWAGRAAPSHADVMLALFVTTLVVTLAATVVFRFSERRAKERGLIDRTTGS